MKTNTKKLILTALFAALSCIATMSIRIPTPGTGGYITPEMPLSFSPEFFSMYMASLLPESVPACLTF